MTASLLRSAVCVALLLACGSVAQAQRHREPLTQAEIDQIRDASWEPKQRLSLYVQFTRARLVKLEQATVTPEAVVLGKGGEVLYRGRIDDNYLAFGKKRSAARQHDLSDALDAIAAGQTVKEKETQAIGCVIQ